MGKSAGIARYFKKAHEDCASGQQNGAGQQGNKRRQATLHDCQKVVRLKTSCLCPQQEELQRLKTLLDAPTSSDNDLLSTLRSLSCYQNVTFEHLKNTGLGTAVRRLRRHSNQAVADLAAIVIERWVEVVKSSGA
jgi:hypothetical protein